MNTAIEWLTQQLGRGPLPNTEILRTSAAEGISMIDVRSAARDLGVVINLVAGGGSTTWRLPAPTGARPATAPTAPAVPTASVMSTPSYAAPAPTRATVVAARPALSSSQWRGRIHAIVLADCARGRELLALTLAANAAISVDEALGTLRAAPRAPGEGGSKSTAAEVFERRRTEARAASPTAQQSKPVQAAATRDAASIYARRRAQSRRG